MNTLNEVRLKLELTPKVSLLSVRKLIRVLKLPVAFMVSIEIIFPNLITF